MAAMTIGTDRSARSDVQAFEEVARAAADVDLAALGPDRLRADVDEGKSRTGLP